MQGFVGTCVAVPLAHLVASAVHCRGSITCREGGLVIQHGSVQRNRIRNLQNLNEVVAPELPSSHPIYRCLQVPGFFQALALGVDGKKHLGRAECSPC